MSEALPFRAKLWIFETSAAPWFLVTLPKELGARIRFESAGLKAGFGSVRVQVTVGDTTWKTSVFPDKKSGSYVLPVKAEVRNNENLKPDKMVVGSLKLL